MQADRNKKTKEDMSKNALNQLPTLHLFSLALSLPGPRASSSPCDFECLNPRYTHTVHVYASSLRSSLHGTTILPWLSEAP